MLTALIALGIFGTILLFLQGCVLLHRMMVPRGTDRAVERIQKWSAPEVARIWTSFGRSRSATSLG